ncbi:MAG TPA: tRNA-dihydrouridine synthase [Campylobacterales bacterium]|nr:tRNA-dihydrouridine synthase [Campylobacterales bacterium]
MIDFSKKDIIFLAPLAGYTDLPFRSVVKKFGVDVTVSEMISANALIYNSARTFKMLEKSPMEIPYIVQIAAGSPEVAQKAVEILNDIEGIDGIDLNCGCPAPKVVGQSCGSSLLEDLPQLSRIVETIKKYSNKEYTSVKTRLGFNEKYPDKIALACENAGADYVTFHGRTRAGRYKSEIDYDAIKEAKDAVKIPVIANGDITTLEIANHVKAYTGCDGIMIGRGAIGNPWLFYQIKNGLKSVKKEMIKEIVLEHFDAMVNFYGDKGVTIFRKHLHTYSKSMSNASLFRDKINRIDCQVLMREEIEAFFSQ